MLRIAIFLILLIGACGYALWRGGAPERMAAGAMLAACAASAIVRADVAQRFVELDAGLLLVDAVLLAILLAIALRADRGWSILVTGLHLGTVGAHAVKFLNPELIEITYAVMLSVLSYPMAVLLAVGTFRHRRRLKARGCDRDWSLRGTQHAPATTPCTKQDEVQTC